MYPRIAFFQWSLSTYSTIHWILAVLALWHIFFYFRKSNERFKITLFILIGGIVSILISKELYQLASAPTNYKNYLFFWNIKGQSFSGIVLGSLCFSYVFRNFLSLPSQIKLNHFYALTMPFFFALLRVACFFNGCCWGSIYGGPLHVTFYHPHSFMPYWGIPVHPVQLYKVFMGFFIYMIVKKIISTSTSQTKVPAYAFLVMFAVGKFLTDLFRWDFSFQKLTWETSTVLMVTFIFFAIGLKGLVMHYFKFKIKNLLRFSLSSLFLLLLISCGMAKKIPVTPNHLELNLLQDLPAYKNKVYQFTKNENNQKPNLIFAAVDDLKQDDFNQFISSQMPLLQRGVQFLSREERIKRTWVFARPIPRMEQLLWSYLIPTLKKTYHKAIYIPHDGFFKQSLFQAIDVMEAQKRPYHLVLMTHGMPGCLITSKSEYFFCQKDLEELQTWNLKYLDFVYLQACYGSSTENLWAKLGASVLSFRDIHYNLFYYGYFLENFEKSKGNIFQAYQQTNNHLKDALADFDDQDNLVGLIKRFSQFDNTDFLDFNDYLNKLTFPLLINHQVELRFKKTNHIPELKFTITRIKKNGHNAYLVKNEYRQDEHWKLAGSYTIDSYQTLIQTFSQMGSLRNRLVTAIPGIGLEEILDLEFNY